MLTDAQIAQAALECGFIMRKRDVTKAISATEAFIASKQYEELRPEGRGAALDWLYTLYQIAKTAERRAAAITTRPEETK